MKSKIHKTILYILISLISTAVQARSVIMPWSYYGMDSYTKNVFENYLLKVGFHKNFLPNSVNFEEYAKTNNIFMTTTQKHKAKKIFIQNGKEPIDTYIQPLSCKVTKTKYIFATVFADINSQRIKHINVNLLDLRRADRANQAKEISANLKNKVSDSPNSKVKLSLSLKRGSQYNAEGSYNCLNILAAKGLIKKYHTKNPVGHFNYKFLSNFLKFSQANIRSNRNLSIEWNVEDTKYENKISLSETTLASPVINPTLAKGNLKDELSIKIPAKIENRLAIMEQVLSEEEPPMVIKVYGAWAYLDKGRAWGLEMNDRLWFEKDGRMVKGHVVAYFGPGLRLTSPRGRKVTEGAIVFIRTGQHSVHIGDTFEFDPTVFPTPWPPVKTPILGQQATL